MENYFEHLVQRKKTTKDYVIVALIILAALLGFYLSSFLAYTPIGMLSFPAQIVSLYLGYRFFGSRNIEFEYCVTGGDLDVDKIVNRQKRTKVASVDSKSITVMAPAGSDKLPPLANKPVQNFTSGEPDKRVYCIVYGEGIGKVIFFEPTETMVLEMQKRNPRNIFVD